MCENRGGPGRVGPNFSDFFQNGPKWSPRALGLLFGPLGGPWALYMGVPGHAKLFPSPAGPSVCHLLAAKMQIPRSSQHGASVIKHKLLAAASIKHW